MSTTSQHDPHALAPAAQALAAAVLAETPARPGSTYRLQLHKGFRLEDAAAILDYLRDLGVTDLYLSPFLSARPGSTHGYDVFDHSRLNPEVGDEPAHARLVSMLADRGMGRVLDVVPNHMGVAGKNPFWLDMLETGPQAPSARFFDVDWHPLNSEHLRGRIELPILGDLYGVVLENGELVVGRDGGALHVDYHETRLPLDPRSYAGVLGADEAGLASRFPAGDADVLEYRSIIDDARLLPARTDLDDASVERVRRETEVIKQRIGRLCAESPRLAEYLDATIAAFRGTPGDPASFDALHGLLEGQVYRLAYWRVAAEEINYRRFFDINDLAGLRVEDPEVFRAVHVQIVLWVEGGGVTALRIDHPDGLADPAGYFRRLQESAFLAACKRKLGEEAGGSDWHDLAPLLLERFRSAAGSDPRVARRFPIVAEKILSGGEPLPADWPIDGTVGYEYLNALNGLFVDPAGGEPLTRAYRDFTGDATPFDAVLDASKSWIANVSMASELTMLAHMLDRVAERDRRSRDFTLADMKNALAGIITCFDVYRTYLRPGQPPSDQDLACIDRAIDAAHTRDPSLDKTVFAFIRSALRLEHPGRVDAEDRRRREAFAVRFQQTTGPVQAKGLEDTAFYRQVVLGSLNEVGGEPTRFGHDPASFHALNAHRLASWPGGLSTTATHDTKRGEDARIRIDALSEMVSDWSSCLARWSATNAPQKVEAKGHPAPDPREEHLFYQTLLGVWPFDSGDGPPSEGFADRIGAYLVKAAREAKVNTSWTDSDPSYAEALATFAKAVLLGEGSSAFLADFLPLQRRVARVGVVHSLAQVLLKVASPGIPDIYQGCDLWDFSLVDPDNRRPVDYKRRSAMLSELNGRLSSGASREDVARDLLASPGDGAIKLYVTSTLLNHRRDHRDFYRDAEYRPLSADGPHADRVVSFARTLEGRAVVAVAPRLVAPLMGQDAATMPIGREVWGETRLILDGLPMSNSWTNLLTGRPVTRHSHGDRSHVHLAEAFEVLPLALLVERSSR